jgi:hypothetical protein
LCEYVVTGEIKKQIETSAVAMLRYREKEADLRFSRVPPYEKLKYYQDT